MKRGPIPGAGTENGRSPPPERMPRRADSVSGLRRAAASAAVQTIAAAVQTIAVAALALVVAAGCGFQLRGWDLETSVESLHVAAGPGIRLAAPLRRTLRQVGVRVEPRPAAAQMILELLDERRDRRTVAVTGSARAAEYEVTLGVRFAIRSGARVLRDAQWLEAGRVFAVDRDNIAGTAAEQALIEEELTNDLVQQIIRALNAAATALAPSGASGAG